MSLTSGMIKTLIEGVVLFGIAIALPLVGASQVAAVTLTPGDIVIADQGLGDLRGPAIIRVDPTTGNQTIVSSGGLLSVPRGVALDVNGDILVAMRCCGPNVINGVLRVDPTTGNQTIVSSAGNFVAPADLALDANGDILVADFFNRVIKVDPVTGAQTVVSSGGNFTTINGIAIAANGDILISDGDVFNVGPGEVIRVNPVTGAQTVVSSGGNFLNPAGIEIAANGDILVANQGFFRGGVNHIIRVDPVTGVQTVVFSSSSILPAAIAFDANDDILAPDFFDGVIKVDPVTGAQTVVSSGGSFVSPVGIAIVPSPAVLAVAIDVKPGGFPNSINPRNKGVIPVAVPTTDTFDATAVDPTTVFFGATGSEAAPVHSALEDVDGDGNTDMILHFRTQDTGIVCGNTSASLTGNTFSGQAIEGSDSIRTVGCK
jgi:hypothetical protein